MQRNHLNRSAALLALAAVAGLPLTLQAQYEDAGGNRNQPADRGGMDDKSFKSQPLSFASASKLDGTDVYNPSGEKIANVSDFIVDRGSGQLRYVVVKSGSILGLGGKSIAIPYGSFNWQPGQERVVLNSTKEQLKTYPEFSAEEWSAMVESKDPSDNNLWRGLGRDDDRDLYRESFTGPPQTINGEITRVEREFTENGEYVTITVKTDEAGTRRITLGPTWYVNPNAAAPMRGDKVTIQAYPVRDSDQGLFIAGDARIGDRDLDLRNEKGAPAWTDEGRAEANRNTAWRYMLLSNLDGMKIASRGEEFGKVDDVIVDRPTGRIAFLSIDPNENFLGIADTKRLVPFQTATVATDGTIRLDASKEMVLASPETPSDINTLNDSARYAMVYRAYDVDVPRFGRDRGTLHATSSTNREGVWVRDGLVLKNLDHNTSQTFSGEITDVTQVSVSSRSNDKAKALKINTPGGTQTVLLGPTAYLDQQPKISCKKGDRVTIQASRATVDGKEHWVATSIEYGGQRTVLIDESGNPSWDDR